MSINHVGHAELAHFARTKVNLPEEKEKEHREQAKRLTDRLDSYLKENPDFELRRIMLSGSLAKGTALRSLNDIDVACYITGVEDRKDISKLIKFLVDKLRTAFPKFQADQIKANTYSVTVSFKGSKLDVDVVPILYDGNKDWYGELVSQRDGSLLETCIPRHIEFIQVRKSKQKRHFSQVIRLIKFWIKQRKNENEEFRFKSFMAELILSKLADKGLDCSNYPEALQHFFTYLVKSNLGELIAFRDYYTASQLLDYPEPIRIIDPVNPKNNASKLYRAKEAQLIVEAAIDAGDAIDAGLFATTKEKTVYYWKKVFGPSFNP